MQATAQQLCEILDAKLVAGTGTVGFQSVFTDTRSPIHGGLFVALKGENFNADDFAEKALESGASIAIVSEWKGSELPKGKAVVEVKDTLFALQRLAHWWRSQLEIPVVCITGSNGKTSTKGFYPWSAQPSIRSARYCWEL